MKYLKIVSAVLLLGSVLAFVAGNTEPVSLRFLIWESPGVSLSLVAAGFFLCGILFTLLLGLLFRLRRGVNPRKHASAGQGGKVSAPMAETETTSTTSPGKD